MEPVKWFFFKLLLKKIGLPGRDIHAVEPKGDLSSPFIWVFCSTIGELNACKPLITKLERVGQLVLITDRDCYQDAFAQHFPNAIYVELNGLNDEAAELCNAYPPHRLVVCEIPATPNDAPCRLNYGFLREVKKAGARIDLVNGWLYGYAPSCRQDAIERNLFTQDYVRCFDTLAVQTEEVKQTLIQAGADPGKLHITGNMKFDAVANTKVVFKDTISQVTVESLQQQSGPILVAGCVAEPWEYQLLIDAFLAVQKEHKDARMVLAPRHPEKQAQLDVIEQMLKTAGVSYQFKSQLDAPARVETQVLVLDTFGELRSYYSVADISYMGRNHNILEPLAFGSPVVILSGWESTYPSFPVYKIAMEHQLVTQVDNNDMLAATVVEKIAHRRDDDTTRIQTILKELATSLERNMTLLEVSP